MKKLRRSKNDRMLAGVCGGVGEYFDVDPTLVRLGAVGLTLFARLGIPVLYLVMAVVMPLDDGVPIAQLEDPEE
ncbi:MAG: PspC domain-containing protein [Anaerolineales bacterium]|nr:PspC domain-containing protein [Anaerolineales bacterium]